MITEDIGDLVKGGLALGVPATSFMGVPLQEWMYIASIVAAILLSIERLPAVFETFMSFKRWINDRMAK